MKKNKFKSRSDEYEEYDDKTFDDDVELKDDDFESVELNNNDENDFEENEEESENDNFFDAPDGFTSEMSEERGSFVHLRYRDNLGRFADPFNVDPEREKEKEIDRKIDRFCREYSKKVLLPYNEKILLLRLVDDFKNNEQIFDEKGWINPKVNHFKRLSYHRVFLDFTNSHYRHLGRSAFSQFIQRMVKKGYVKRIKHGRKLYLKITKLGLKKVFDFWEEYPGESWGEP